MFKPLIIGGSFHDMLCSSVNFVLSLTEHLVPEALMILTILFYCAKLPIKLGNRFDSLLAIRSTLNIYNLNIYTY